ncbi:MAG: metallophosphoesterase [Pseudobutyrivibrio sp.]|nr:metallophosphoesterase [Pseudobutyrivibrio sp.]
MDLLTEKNYKWIYTYDYEPRSIWDPWRQETGPATWIEEEVDDVAARVNSHPGLPTFALIADSHYVENGTWDDTIASLRALDKKIKLNGIIHLGDLSDGLLPLDRTLAIEQRCISDMESLGHPLYIVPGNHDYNYFRGNPELKYPDRPQYYKDLSGEKLRLIFIDSFEPKEQVRYGFSMQCVGWLEYTLRTMPSDYRALIFSHVPPLLSLQAWAKDMRHRHELVTVMDTYADRILAFINGHNHCDQIFNGLNNGMFPIVSINCAKCEYYTDHKPNGATVPKRRLGDRTQESFDILQIDAAAGKLFFTRFGAGTDRIVENHKGRFL